METVFGFQTPMAIFEHVGTVSVRNAKIRASEMHRRNASRIERTFKSAILPLLFGRTGPMAKIQHSLLLTPLCAVREYQKQVWGPPA